MSRRVEWLVLLSELLSQDVTYHISDVDPFASAILGKRGLLRVKVVDNRKLDDGSENAREWYDQEQVDALDVRHLG